MDLKQHPDHPELWVTPEGDLFQKLTSSPADGGYHTVKMKGGVTARRHTLVLETYKGPRPLGMVARHLDGNPANDHKDNLEWGTQAENVSDAIGHGTFIGGASNAKVTPPQVLEIYKRGKQGESGSALAKEFGLSHSSVCDIVAGRTWKKVTSVLED